MSRYYLHQIVGFGAVICVLTVSVATGDTLPTDDYSFDVPALKKKPLELTASIELWPSVILLNSQSLMYALKYGQDGNSYSDAYNIKAEGSARYQRGALLAVAAGALSGGYVRFDDSIAYNAR